MKYHHNTLSDRRCKICGKFLKLNLIKKKPDATRCYFCHKIKGDVPFEVSHTTQNPPHALIVDVVIRVHASKQNAQAIASELFKKYKASQYEAALICFHMLVSKTVLEFRYEPD